MWVPSAERAPWVREWVSELVEFLQLRHDNRVDACAMALQRLRSYVEAYRVVVPGRKFDLDRVAF